MDVYNKAIKKWGKRTQMVMAIEEMAELTQALTKNLRGKDHNVEEEIADVKIMIGQLEEIFDKEAIAKWEKFKIETLETFLESE